MIFLLLLTIAFFALLILPMIATLYSIFYLINEFINGDGSWEELFFAALFAIFFIIEIAVVYSFLHNL